MAASEESRVGVFHAKCSTSVELSNERRVASGKENDFSVAFSNDQISIGSHFSVKILQEGSNCVSPTRASSRPHTSDAPYTAEGAVHVVHCWLFFVFCDGIEGT